MYRPFTTTGTNRSLHKYDGFKKTAAALWIAAVIVSRGVFLFCSTGQVWDVYGFFARSMIRLEKGTPPLDCGLSYAYTESLSRLLRFAGNRMEAVGLYQMILQVLWLILLFAGISLLFGRVAGIVTGSVLAVSFWMMETILVIWPGNFYMLHFTIALMFLGYVRYRIKKGGWPSNDFGRLCLAAIGFYVGVLCIWDILGGILAAVMICLLFQNYFFLKKDTSGKKDGEKETNAKGRMMGTGTQAVALIEGILIGIFVTLMKYTGVSGEAIAGQAKWWISQMRSPFALYSEMQVPFILRILGAALAGVLCQLLVNRRFKVKGGIPSQEDGGIEAASAMAGLGKGSEKEMAGQAEAGKYIITEDGRRIKLLDNPLPGPKEHVRKEMDFDLDFEMEAADDFDIKITDGDDFDI